jgi:adenylate kinase
MNESFTFPINAILLLGPSGVGKTPLGDAVGLRGLFDRLCRHLDFGAELRRAVSGGEQSDPYSPSELDFIHGVLVRGLLLEDQHFPLAEKIISLFLKRANFSQTDILVLNGIPRHEGQARDIERVAMVHAVVVLDCSAEEVLKRIEGNVGGDRTERVDDNIELIGRKLKTFRERTTPLIEHYEKKGRKIYRLSITGSTTPADAYTALSGLAAVHPPVSLVAEPPVR